MPNTFSFLKNIFSLTFFVVSIQVFAQEYGGSEQLKINNNVEGTLLTPDTPTRKLAIIIPGSGPTDRDGNQQGLRNNSLKLLAEGLSAQGIASYRYDKRVLTLLKRNALQEDKLSFEMFIEDAIATTDFFVSGDRFTEVYIIGHSQGSLVGMVAAQQIDVHGFISLTGPGQAIDQTIINQIKLQNPSLNEETIKAFKTLKEVGKVTDYPAPLASIFRPSVQPFMASWMQYDPKIEIGKLEGSDVLIINGDNDIQISEEEAKLLQEGNPTAKLVTISKMNHVLRIIDSDDALENTKAYNERGTPIATQVVREIVGFINR